MLVKTYLDTPHGQLHARRAGAADLTSTPLFLLHPSPNTSRAYEELVPILGQNRLAVAMDTPGFGDSFRPTRQPSISDYARWLAEGPTALGFEQFDILGQFTGAATAVEMAIQFPTRVRRVILAGPPLFTPEQQAGFVRDAWPARPTLDGSHLTKEWGKIVTRRPPSASLAAELDLLVDYYRGGANAIWGEEAVAVYPLAQKLPQVTQPTLVIKPEAIHGDAAGAYALLKHGTLAEIAMSGYAIMRAGAQQVADIINSFLDRS